MKGVPNDIEEVHITKILQYKFPGIYVKRFLKTDVKI